MNKFYITAETAGGRKYLQGPRPPKLVKKLGYRFTFERSEAWPFDTEKAAANKARIVNAHMGWGDRCKAEPVEPTGFVWAWLSSTLEILIPKQRGKGWLQVPAGHHISNRIRAIEEAAQCDICGIDGTLSIECGSKVAVYPERRQELIDRLFPVVSREYRTQPDREVGYHFIEREINGRGNPTPSATASPEEPLSAP